MLKSRMLFGFFFAMSVLLILFYYNTGVSFLIFYSLLILLLFSLATVLSAPLFLKIEEQAEQDYAYKNDEMLYTAQIRNWGIFVYPQVKYTFHTPEVVNYNGQEASPAIGPISTAEAEYTVRFPYRGVYEIGIKSISVTDFLGLFRISIPMKKALSVAVYPDSDEEFAVSIRRDAQNTSLSNDLFNEDYTDVADVRKYTPSDSYKKIHWKLSAKRNELIVKNFKSKVQNRTILFLDTKSVPLSGMNRAEFEDKMVSYAASAIQYCMRGRLQAEFIYGEAISEPELVDASSDLGRVFRLLAEITFTNEKSLLHTFFERVDESAGSYNMILFLSGIDGEIYDALSGVAAMDNNLFVYFFHSSQLPLDESKEFYLEGLKSSGVSVNKIYVA